MKSAYELAMERLSQSEPQKSLTTEQKAELAEVDDKFKAKIAEKELFLGDLIAKAKASYRYDELKDLETQRAREIGRLREECEAAKEEIRNR